MTDDTSAPCSGFDSACWLVRDQEFVKLCKSVLAENKTALFDVLAAARIDSVEITFNGYADEGQIDGAVADGEGGDTDFHCTHVEIARVEWGNQIVTRQTLSVKDESRSLSTTSSNRPIPDGRTTRGPTASSSSTSLSEQSRSTSMSGSKPPTTPSMRSE